MNYLKIILLIFVNFKIQANEIYSSKELEARLFKDWIYAYEVSEINTPNVIITRPPKVELLLFKVNFIENGGTKLNHHCVYYRVPFKKNDGKLIISENKNLDNCEEVPNGKILYELDNIQNFKYSLQLFELKIEFEILKHKNQWIFPLLNTQSKSEHVRFKSETKKMRFPGLHLLRMDVQTDKFIKNLYIGNLEDSFASSTSIKCYKVDKNCNQIGENLCDRCRYGFYEVVDFNCPNGGSKYCGINHCGKKGWPACPRGNKTKDQDIDGICEDNLKPILNSENILICQ